MHSKKSEIYSCCFTAPPVKGFRVIWQLTTKCNRNCPYCFSAKNKAELSTQEALRAIDKLAKLGTSSILLTGGEPFLRKDILPIMQQVSNKGITVSVSTNADFLTENHFKAFEKLKFGGIVLSLDSCHEEINDSIRGRGNYGKVVTAMERLKALDCEKQVNIVLSEQNQNHSAKTIEFVKEKGVTSVTISPQWFHVTQATEVLKQLKGLQDIGLPITLFRIKCGNETVLSNCKFVKNNFGIYSDGRITPCLVYPYDKNPITATVFDDASKIKKAIEEWQQKFKRESISDCMHCTKRNSCGKGCPAIAGLNKKDSLCDEYGLFEPVRKPK